MKYRTLRDVDYSIISPEQAKLEIDNGNEDIFSITCYVKDTKYYGFTPTRLTRGPIGTNGQTIYAEVLYYCPAEEILKLSELDFPFFNPQLVEKKSKVVQSESQILKLIEKIKVNGKMCDSLNEDITALIEMRDKLIEASNEVLVELLSFGK